MNKTQRAYIAQSILYSGIVFALALWGFIWVIIGKQIRDFAIAIGPLSFALMIQIFIGYFFNPIYTRAKLNNTWARVILILMTIAFVFIVLLLIYTFLIIFGAISGGAAKGFGIAVMCLVWTTMLPYFIAIVIYAIGHAK
ncbi:hypothetical protein ACJA27_00025 [Mycoplasmopsis lipophila]|uniref:hypothetical protein n=1 Tax=Mycoplasmopsis lipophila TaxID=2117 RepID=UPI0038738654